MRLEQFPGSCAGVVITGFGDPLDLKEFEVEIRFLINRVRLAPYLLIMINQEQDKVLHSLLEKIGFDRVDARYNYASSCILYVNNPSKVNEYFKGTATDSNGEDVDLSG